MKPYDWCDPRCPNPCSCQKTIEENYRLFPIGDTTFERWYRAALEHVGVRYLNPHQTRHTYGHRLRELGFDIEERQVAMGHESIRTTQHYYGRVTVEDVATKIAGANL
jgi:integrase